MVTLRNKDENLIVRWVRPFVLVYFALFIALTSSGSIEATHRLLHLFTQGGCTAADYHDGHRAETSILQIDSGHSVCSLEVIAKAGTSSVLLASKSACLSAETLSERLNPAIPLTRLIARETIHWSSSRGPPAVA